MQAQGEEAQNGRPTKLTPDLIKKASGYLKWCENHPVEAAKAAFQGAYSDSDMVPRLPSVTGLCAYIGISRETAKVWRKENLSADFSGICEAIEAAQEEMLLTLGVSGRFSPAVVNRILANRHGYIEKTDITSDGKALPTPILGGITQNPDAEGKG